MQQLDTDVFSAVLYVFGTVISLIGTGFVIGVRLDTIIQYPTQQKLILSYTTTVLQAAEACTLILRPIFPVGCDMTKIQMFKPVRIVASIVFLASIGLVFVAAFVLHSDVRDIQICHPAND